MFELEGTRQHHGRMQRRSKSTAAAAQIEVIAADFEYPLTKENFAPSLSMYTMSFTEDNRCPHSIQFFFSSY